MLIANSASRRVSASAAVRGGDYECPGCHEPVVLKRGRVKIAHFSHQKNGLCVRQEEPETAEHLSGKWQIQQQFNGDLEVYLSVISQRPDILCRRANRLIAIEFQCSALSTSRLEERTDGYRKLGIEVVWLLGKKYRDRFKKASGAHPFVVFTQRDGWLLRFWRVDCECLEVWKNLQVDWLNRLCYRSNCLVAGQWRETGWIQVRHTARERQLLERQITIGLKTRNRRFLGWQQFCYWRNSLLQVIPDVCWTTRVIPPVLGTSIVIWRRLLLAQLDANWLHRGIKERQLWRWSQQVTELTNGAASGSSAVLSTQYALAIALMADLEANGQVIRKHHRWFKRSSASWGLRMC